jgi:hypothetical protein
VCVWRWDVYWACDHPLWVWARRERVKMKDLAKRMGVSAVAIHYWRVGKNCPSPEAMAKIERLTVGAVSASDCINYFMEKKHGE